MGVRAEKQMPGQGQIALDFEGYSLTSGYLSPLKNVTFRLAQGDAMAVVGPANSGKSMLLYVISQMMWEALGKGVSIEQRGIGRILNYSITPRKPTQPVLEILQSQIALVGESSSWLPLSISENFNLSQSFYGFKEAIPFLDLIESLPLSQRHKATIASVAEHLPSQVEPALLQHLAIARALLRHPALLLLDEPFMRMDPVLLKQTERLIAEMSANTTLVWATNDLYQASRMTDWTLFLLDGEVIEFTATPQFFTNPQTRQAENFIAGRDEG